MNSQTWKNFERQVARYFGTERMPLSGMSNYLEKQDTLSDYFFIECKLRSKLPIWDFWERNGDFRLRDEWLVIHSKNFKRPKIKVNTNRFKAVLTLYNKTEKLSEGSGKIPIVAVKKFKKRGFLLIIKEKDMDKIKQLIEPEVEYGLQPQIKTEKISTDYLSISSALPLVKETKNFINLLAEKPKVDILAEVRIMGDTFCQINKKTAERLFNKLPIYEINTNGGDERLIKDLNKANNYNVLPEDVAVNNNVLIWLKEHTQLLINELENLVFKGLLDKQDFKVLVQEIRKKINIKTTIEW